MFAAQRIQKIKDIMLEQKSIDIITLSSILGVSKVTVRKDLDTLEKEGFLNKTHGGAILNEEVVNDDQKTEIDVQCSVAKEQIADLACTLLDDEDIIFLGSGSTCYMFAKKIKELKNITVVTNNINAINELYPHIKNVHFIGGEITSDENMLYTVGQKALDYLDGMFFNKAFIGIDGIDSLAGFTVNDLSNFVLLKRVLDIAKYNVFMADYSKFDKNGLHQICTIDCANCVITDKKLKSHYKQLLFNKNIKVLTSFDL